MLELTKSFRFEAAHSLSGTTFGEASEEIHSHSFRTEVTARGTLDPHTGMMLDLGALEQLMPTSRRRSTTSFSRASRSLALRTPQTWRDSSSSVCSMRAG